MKLLDLQEIVSSSNYKMKYTHAKAKNTCVRCGKAAKKFRDSSSKFEYDISALCQACQDDLFKDE